MFFSGTSTVGVEAMSSPSVRHYDGHYDSHYDGPYLSPTQNLQVKTHRPAVALSSNHASFSLQISLTLDAA